MKRNVFAIAAILILAIVMTACGGGSNNKVADGAKDMRSVLADVKAAVEAGDAAKAKSEGTKLEESWKKFEDDVKAKSKDNYDKVESPLHIIEAGVAMDPLDKETINKAIAELDSVLSETEKL